MVSSLPFLAPVFMRKAKEYRSKRTNRYGSSENSSHHVGKGSEAYKLGSVGRDKDTFGSAKVKEVDAGSSEENILAGSGTNQSIVRSMTYSVTVDDELEKGPKTKVTGGRHYDL